MENNEILEKEIRKLKVQLRKKGILQRKPGAGAPKKEPGKVKDQVIIYVEKENIELIGGKEAMREFLKQAVNNHIQTLKN